jgi:hypothetical protein
LEPQEQILGVRNFPGPHRMRSVATFLGLVTASLVFLCAGSLLAVTREGLPRLLFACGGFSGYLFLFAHALQELALPQVWVEGRPAPDGEVHRKPAFQRARETADRDRVFTAAA